MLLGPEEQDGHMGRGCAELACNILARNPIDQAQVNDRALYLVQRRHAAEEHCMLFGRGNDLVGRGGIGSQALDGRVINNMRPCVIMATAAVARDVARENDQHPSRIIGPANEESRLRQTEEARECFLDTVQRIIGP
jgi:hypothetical protein